MRSRFRFGVAAVMSASAIQFAMAVVPTSGELAEARRWAAAKFDGAEKTNDAQSGLHVLANHDPVTLNTRGGSPLNVAGREFTRGLYCHAVSRIIVRLPAPGKTFSAIAGLDSNDDTRRGKGSVVFSVTAGGKELFKSGVQRVDSPAVPVPVDLGGATEFTLEIGDAGDGIGWDQSDWADAKVELAGGNILWLGDMPIVTAQKKPIGPEPFFSFNYDGKPSSDFLGSWKLKRESRELDSQRVERTLTYSDPKSGLAIHCVGVEYRDFPVVEWTLYFKNTGATNSPIVENIEALDTQLTRDDAGEFLLRGNKGDWCAPESYEPVQFDLRPRTSQRFSPVGGRPTNGERGWPYFNLKTPDGGLILAVGWPGQWAASFERDDKNALRIRAGQEQTHFYLKPGEEIRTPLIALFFWQGADVARSQNLWRRWMIAHNVPRVGGELPKPMLQMQCYRTFEHGGEKDMFDTVQEFLDAKIPWDLCWRDAGWYACTQWPQTGTWEIDTNRYPNGFGPFADFVHKQDKKFIVWFEPERVGDGNSWLAKNHPDWIIGGNLLNLGNDDARKWLTDHIDAFIKREGLDWYRQDFNMDPLGNWRGNDAPDRRGITENKHVSGYLAFWDELLKRNPKLRIDSCSSGGRRNDLETLRRAVPLLRSDFQFGHGATMPNQGHTYGISSWIPYYGSGCTFSDAYSERSYLMPCTGFAGHDAATKRCYDEARKIIPFMLGDYYPLMSYSIADDAWIAWQFDRPETGDGMIQIFRREHSLYESARLRLRGLEPDTTYALTNPDIAATTEKSGRELMDGGLVLAIPSHPAAVIITYKKKP